MPRGTIALGGITIVNPSDPLGGNNFRDTDPAGMILEGDITAENTPDGSTRLVGEIKNIGKLRVAATADSSSYLRLAEAAKPYVALTGGGQVILGTLPDGTLGNDNAFITEDPSGFATKTLNNVDNTIHGFGRLGRDPNYGHFLNLENSGTIAADVTNRTLAVEINSGKNSGFVRSTNSGTMIFRSTGLDNAGGVLEALQTSPFKFNGATITGGTLRNVGAGSTALNFDLANATLMNLTLQGPLHVRDFGGAGLVGTIENEGTIRLLSSSDNTRTRLSIGSGAVNSVTLNGPGQLILGDPALGGSAASVEAASGTNNPTLTLNQTLRGFGAVGYNQGSDRGMHLVNNAIVNADVSGKQLTVVPHTIVNSPGKELKASNGGKLYLHPIQLTNTDATISAAGTSKVIFDGQTTLTGGLVSSAPGGSIDILSNLSANGGVVFTNAGTMNIGSSGGNIFNGLADGGASIISSGTINKLGGTDYSMRAPLNDTGAINVQSGILRWKAGGTVSGGNLSAASGTDHTFEIEPFTFSGTTTFSGAGKHWFANNTVTLADSDTILNVTGKLNFGSYGTSLLTGPGTVSASGGGGLSFLSGATTFSGTKLVTLAGSNSFIDKQNGLLQFSDGATWKNSGTVSMGGYINVLNGASGTLFTNMPGGVFRVTGAQENRFAMPYLNSGEFFMESGSLPITSNGIFFNGSAKVEAGLRLTPIDGATTTFDGVGNTATGDGFFGPVDATFNFVSGAKLTGENIGIYSLFSAGTVTGNGILEVTKNLEIGKGITGYATPDYNITISGTLVRVAPTATATFGIRHSEVGAVHLTNGAVFENAGRTNHYSFAGIDGTGLFRSLKDANSYFYRIGLNGGGGYVWSTVSAPFDIAGSVWAEQGKVLTFSGGGLLNETAKIWPNDPNSEITFTGADKIYQARGRAVEFNGTGYVNFVNTTLEFLPSTLSTVPGNGVLDESRINAGAHVAFHGDNVIRSSQALLDLGRQGTLNAPIVFQSGDQVVDNAILTTNEAGDSAWNATGRKLSLINGAKFINAGRFIIQAKVGNPLFIDSGITSDNSGVLFHNTSTGRLVHDTNDTTDFNVDTLNDGFLEFRRGTFNFRKNFSGRGGIAASNGAQLNLSLVGVPLDQQPAAFEVNGTSIINLQLAAGQTLGGSISINGGQMVAAGGLNMVAAGGLNMVAAGGGNLVAAGGMNMVAAGGGNITAIGAGSLIRANEMVAAGGGNILSQNGGVMVAAGGLNAENGGQATANGGTIRNEGSAPMVAAGGGNILSHNGGVMVAAGGGNILSHNGGVMVAAGGGNIRSETTAPMVAAGGGNMVAAGGGNMVAAGGGNMVAAGGGNIQNRVVERVAAHLQTATMAKSRTLSRDLSGEGERAAFMQPYLDLNTDPNMGMILVEAGGNARAENGGTIMADHGGILAGSGTYTGPGLIKNGGAMMPGSSPGTLTWNGNLTFEGGLAPRPRDRRHHGRHTARCRQRQRHVRA